MPPGGALRADLGLSSEPERVPGAGVLVVVLLGIEECDGITKGVDFEAADARACACVCAAPAVNVVP